MFAKAAALGNAQAEKNLLQTKAVLGTVLGNSSKSAPPTAVIPLLREAAALLTQSAELGNGLAQKNLPLAQYDLGVALADSSINLLQLKEYLF